MMLGRVLPLSRLAGRYSVARYAATPSTGDLTFGQCVIKYFDEVWLPVSLIKAISDGGTDTHGRLSLCPPRKGGNAYVLGAISS